MLQIRFHWLLTSLTLHWKTRQSEKHQHFSFQSWGLFFGIIAGALRKNTVGKELSASRSFWKLSATGDFVQNGFQYFQVWYWVKTFFGSIIVQRFYFHCFFSRRAVTTNAFRCLSRAVFCFESGKHWSKLAHCLLTTMPEHHAKFLIDEVDWISSIKFCCNNMLTESSGTKTLRSKTFPGKTSTHGFPPPAFNGLVFIRTMLSLRRLSTRVLDGQTFEWTTNWLLSSTNIGTCKATTSTQSSSWWNYMRTKLASTRVDKIQLPPSVNIASDWIPSVTLVTLWLVGVLVISSRWPSLLFGCAFESSKAGRGALESIFHKNICSNKALARKSAFPQHKDSRAPKAAKSDQIHGNIIPRHSFAAAKQIGLLL